MKDGIIYFELSVQCFSELIQDFSMPVILQGDFNLPEIDWSCYSSPTNAMYDKFIDFLNEFGLSQFVHEPTRISNTGNGLILDLVTQQKKII